MQPRPARLDVYYGSDLVGAVHDSAPLAFEYASTWLEASQRMSLATIPLQRGRQAGESQGQDAQDAHKARNAAWLHGRPSLVEGED